jgi:hypothetical protein
VSSTARHLAGSPGDTGPSGDRWHLHDEADFLRRSLADAAQEHGAGDLGDDDYAVLRARDEFRLAGVEAQLAALGTADAGRGAPAGGGGPADARAPGPEEGAASGRGRRRSWYAVVGAAALAAAAVLAVFELAAPRLPGQTPTGGIKLTTAQTENEQLAQAAADEQHGDLPGALTLYGRVLAADPGQSAALAEFGWIEWETGANRAVRRGGETLVERSVARSPAFYPGHLYLGTIETLSGTDPAAAVAQFRLFLAEHPPAAKVAAAAGYIRRAFGADHQPLPPGVPTAPAPPATSIP